jgi:hypothetical protein
MGDSFFISVMTEINELTEGWQEEILSAGASLFILVLLAQTQPR